MTDGNAPRALPATPPRGHQAACSRQRNVAIDARVTAAQLLDAMEGVAYLTDLDGIILAVGRQGWSRFSEENAAPGLTVDRVIGTSIFAAMTGDEVRDAYRRLHDAVASGRRAMTVFEYRCDSPIAERHMRMSISAVAGEDGIAAVLYQSQIVAEVMRPPLRLFARELRGPRADAGAARPAVLLCAFCHRVAWPLDADRARRRWIDATEYYRRGGPSDVAVMDSVCQACARRVVTPHL